MIKPVIREPSMDIKKHVHWETCHHFSILSYTKDCQVKEVSDEPGKICLTKNWTIQYKWPNTISARIMNRKTLSVLPGYSNSLLALLVLDWLGWTTDSGLCDVSHITSEGGCVGTARTSTYLNTMSSFWVHYITDTSCACVESVPHQVLYCIQSCYDSAAVPVCLGVYSRHKDVDHHAGCTTKRINLTDFIKRKYCYISALQFWDMTKQIPTQRVFALQGRLSGLNH